MKRRKSKRGIYCSKCGTKLADGWACDRKSIIFFWYCSTCDEFVRWQGPEVSEEGKESMKSFLRYAKRLADADELRPRSRRKTRVNTEP